MVWVSFLAFQGIFLGHVAFLERARSDSIPKPWQISLNMREGHSSFFKILCTHKSKPICYKYKANQAQKIKELKQRYSSQTLKRFVYTIKQFSTKYNSLLPNLASFNPEFVNGKNCVLFAAIIQFVLVIFLTLQLVLRTGFCCFFWGGQREKYNLSVIIYISHLISD